MHKGAGAILVTAAVQQNLLQPWRSNAHLSLSYTNGQIKRQERIFECGGDLEGVISEICMSAHMHCWLF